MLFSDLFPFIFLVFFLMLNHFILREIFFLKNVFGIFVLLTRNEIVSNFSNNFRFVSTR